LKTFDSLYYEILIALNKFYLAIYSPLGSYPQSANISDISSNRKIDLLIPAIEKDIMALPIVVNAARNNVLHSIKNIFVISNSKKIKQFCSDFGCVYVDEDSVLPIKKTDIHYKVGGKDRSGWLFQQFLKLNGDEICEMEDFLVLDADTVLVKPISFIEQGKNVFYFSDEFNITYYRTFQYIYKKKVKSFRSFVSHMMLFNCSVLREFRNEIERLHDHTPWYEVFLASFDYGHPAAFSEFECYGNYFYLTRRSQMVLRYWYNKKLDISKLSLENELENLYGDQYRSLSFHVYPQQSPDRP